MLSKLKTVPLKVTLNALFLVAMLAAVLVLHPPLGLFILVVIAGTYSLVTLLNYWLEQQ